MNGEALLSPHKRSLCQSFVRLYRKTTTSDFIHKVAETFVTRILLIGIGLITSVIVARVLGPEGRGLYAVAATIVAIGVQFGNLGLHASNTYSVARNPQLLSGLVSNSIFVSFVVGGVSSVLVGVILSLQPEWVQIQGLLLLLSLISIPFGLAYLLLQNLLVGINDIHSYNTIELGTRIISLALVGTMIVLHAITVETLYLATVFTIVGGFVWTLRQLKTRLIPFPWPSFSLLKKNLSYGLKAYVAALFAFFVLRADLLMIQYMLGAEQTGFYAVAVGIADLLYLLPVIFGTVLFPRLTGMKTDDDRWVYTRQVAQWIALIMVVVAGLVAFCGAPLIRLLYGRMFIPAVPALIWLMPGIIFLSINTILMNYFASIGMPLITVYSPCAAAVLNIGLNVKLIPIWGIVGASIASVAAYGMMLVASLIYIAKQRAYSHI